MLKELIFEVVRLSEFRDRPSRFNCNFLCPTISSARNFVQQTARSYDLLYEVELEDKEANRLETDWSLISQVKTGEKQPKTNVAAIENFARKYWAPQSVNENVKEILVDSNVRILRCRT